MQQMQLSVDEAIQRLERIVEIHRAEQSAATAVRWGATVGLIEERRQVLQHSIDELKSQVRHDFEQDMRQRARDAEEEKEKQMERDKDQDLFIEKSIQKQNKLSLRMDEVERQEKENRKISEDFRWAFDEKLRNEIAEVRLDADNRIKAIEMETKRMHTVVEEVENIPTRRVDWVIKNATSRLQPSSTATKRWLSPKFGAAGAHDLQVEIRVNPPQENRPAVSDCSVFLWASEPGLRLVCKLSIGSTSEQYEHSFDGVSPCGSQHFPCLLQEHINNSDDTLRVQVELLEAIRQVRHLPRAILSTEASVDVGRKTGIELSDGALVYHRHLCHRTLELVQSQVDRMNSRMVRKIEWRLENASQLRRYFAEGESLCSTKFEAAGLGNLQLVFYPTGYIGAKDGHCSLFLYCPGGTALHCWLLAGKQRREARHAFEESTFFGRTNFCRFESCVELSDDSILLEVEIDEAQPSITEWMWHQPPSSHSLGRGPASRPASRLASTPASVVGSSPSPEVAWATSECGESPQPQLLQPHADAEQQQQQQPHIESTVTLKRINGRAALEDIRRLPSVWTTPAVDEGYHTFADIKGKKRPNTPLKQPMRPAGQPLPQKVDRRYMMYVN
jgi:hypothetical protein